MRRIRTLLAAALVALMFALGTSQPLTVHAGSAGQQLSIYDWTSAAGFICISGYDQNFHAVPQPGQPVPCWAVPQDSHWLWIRGWYWEYATNFAVFDTSYRVMGYEQTAVPPSQPQNNWCVTIQQSQLGANPPGWESTPEGPC